jgi:CRP-like cAMP-binding protein
VSVVDEIRRRVDERLAELQPAVDEYQELMTVKRGLTDGADAPASSPRPPANTPRRATSRRARQTASTSRRSGGRAEQAIQIVSSNPGVTVTEIAAQMGINQNYLYRLLPRMESEGKLRREGKGWALPVG